MSGSKRSLGEVGILWRGNAEERQSASLEESRFKAIAAALIDAGVAAKPVIYEDDVADEVRSELLGLDGVLVWVNPIHEGHGRANLDALLREVAASGVWISAHPDVIAKMGTKEVLHRTRMMSWGSDTCSYPTIDALRAGLAASLNAGPRVVKRNRGNGGQGVWKVEALSTEDGLATVRVMDATKDLPEDLTLDAFVERCSSYFADGSVIDQPFQLRLGEGVVRCYMAGERCAGFGHQRVKALVSGAARHHAGPRIYSSGADPHFQRLRRSMEADWTPQLCAILGIAAGDLPVIWDADFMLGPSGSDGNDSYVLGEINVSSVFPVPDTAPVEIARCVANRLQRKML